MSRGADRDLYVADRASLEEPFALPAPLDELNTSSNEVGPWLSPNRSVLCFHSDRSGSSRSYCARR